MKKIYVIIFIIWGIFSLSMLFLSRRGEYNEKQDLLKEYNIIGKNDSFSSHIKYSYFPKSWRGASAQQYVKLENNQGIILCITNKRINTDNNTPDLNQIISKGVFVKKTHNQTL